MAFPPEQLAMLEHEITIRVRYQETDAQGRVHHANYINFFEIGRVEFLRAAGYRYKELEAAGILLVVTEMECRYLAPAQYDDELKIKTIVVRAHGARIEHRLVPHLGRPEGPWTFHKLDCLRGCVLDFQTIVATSSHRAAVELIGNHSQACGHV